MVLKSDTLEDLIFFFWKFRKQTICILFYNTNCLKIFCKIVFIVLMNNTKKIRLFLVFFLIKILQKFLIRFLFLLFFVDYL